MASTTAAVSVRAEPKRFWASAKAWQQDWRERWNRWMARMRQYG